MNDIKKMKEQYGDKHPGFGSYTECMSRALLTGLATFALTFSGTYFAQYLLQVKIPQKPKTRLIAPAVLSCVASWVITARRTQMCQQAWMANEGKHTFLTDTELEPEPRTPSP